ncbi:histidine kinase [Shewanella mangrovi]|uniref:histidine kinase n=1 Tax=Shewanella mangrovi TaxID=1515746 RepID=A0A094JE28_9GAMM|nr:sensor histidine kinase [Shewanella mangrovi]KFZ37482.1 histidine kinase [Shewanella mangrovi]
MKLKRHFITSILLATAWMLTLMSFTVFHLLKTTHDESLETRSLEMASIVALDPVVINAVEEANQHGGVNIRPYIESLRAQTEVTFIVVVNKYAIRLSHPDPKKVGQKFVGEDLIPVLENGIKHSNYAVGSLGKAIRSFAPVMVDGKVVGAVCVGILNEEVAHLFIKQHSNLLIVVIMVLLVAIMLIVTLMSKLNRTMKDLDPELVVNMLMEHDRIFNAIRDPIVSIDNNLNITAINDIATKIIAMGSMGKKDFIHQPLARFSTALSQIVKAGTGREFTGTIKLGKLDYRVCIYPLQSGQEHHGYVIIFLSDMQLNELKKELIYYKNYAELLRSKTHEYSNKLNVLSGMLQLQHYDDAIEFIDRESKGHQRIIGNIVRSIQNSTVASLLLAKYNKAAELGVKYLLDEDNILKDYSKPVSEKLATILANLIDNGILAACNNKHNAAPMVQIYVSDRSQHVILEVQDSGAGVAPEIADNILEFGVSSKDEQEQTGVGLYLVNELVNQLNGSIDWERTEDNTTLFSIYLDKGEIKRYEEESHYHDY